MFKLITVLTLALLSTTAFSDTVLEATASSNEASATTVRVTTCQKSYNSATLAAVPYLIALARIQSRLLTPACQAAIATFNNQKTAENKTSDFEVVSYGDENIQVGHTAPTGESCTNQFVGYVVSYCDVKIAE